MGLVIGGGVTAGAGAIVLVAGGIAYATVQHCYSDYNSVTMTNTNHCYADTVPGFITMMTGVGLIGVGAIPFLIGIAGYTYDLVPASEGSRMASLRLQLAPFAPGAQVGGSIALEF